MSRLERAGTLGRVSQSLAVLGSSLLPPPVLQLVHHLPLVFCIIIDDFVLFDNFKRTFRKFHHRIFSLCNTYHWCFVLSLFIMYYLITLKKTFRKFHHRFFSLCITYIQQGNGCPKTPILLFFSTLFKKPLNNQNNQNGICHEGGGGGSCVPFTYSEK